MSRLAEKVRNILLTETMLPQEDCEAFLLTLINCPDCRRIEETGEGAEDGCARRALLLGPGRTVTCADFRAEREGAV